MSLSHLLALIANVPPHPPPSLDILLFHFWRRRVLLIDVSSPSFLKGKSWSALEPWWPADVASACIASFITKASLTLELTLNAHIKAHFHFDARRLPSATANTKNRGSKHSFVQHHEIQVAFVHRQIEVETERNQLSRARSAAT